MIIDHIRNLGRYARLFEDADKIAAFFAEHPLEELKLSQSCPVAGTDYILSPVKIEPKPFEEKRWEGHRRHTDLHLVIRGREYLGWIPVSEMKMSSDYAEEPDVGFFEDRLPGSRISLEEGYFALFLPEDIHKPMLSGEGSGGIKLLLKARA
ncbi:MAG: DUF386 domain-containing protein [Provencibacterium sp.]|jgi:YhcH/YjgK/YiaL family protein|nr:DUF386 domain-containing protein [Provencibacterium sp.]